MLQMLAVNRYLINFLDLHDFEVEGEYLDRIDGCPHFHRKYFYIWVD